MKAGSIARCLTFMCIAWLPGFAQHPATGKTQQPSTDNPPSSVYPPATVYPAAAPSQAGVQISQDTQFEVMAKPITWGEKSVRLFRESDILLNFKLATSWIPGSNQEGMFRFKVSAFPKMPAKQAQDASLKKPGSSDEIEKLLASAHKCKFGLMLNDSDGFLLRTVPVSFVNVVDEGNGQNIGLLGNSSVQMDADEYLKFIGSDGAKGTWQVSWGADCTLDQ